MAKQLAEKESEDQRGWLPVTETTTKEDGDPDRRRWQSADEEDNKKEAMTQRGPFFLEARDGDNSKVGGELQWQSRRPGKMAISRSGDGNQPMKKMTTKGGDNYLTREATRRRQSADKEAMTKGTEMTKGRTKRRKSNHVASSFIRGFSRTFDVVQFYDQGLVVPSHIWRVRLLVRTLLENLF